MPSSPNSRIYSDFPVYIKAAGIPSTRTPHNHISPSVDACATYCNIYSRQQHIPAGSQYCAQGPRPVSTRRPETNGFLPPGRFCCLFEIRPPPAPSHYCEKLSDFNLAFAAWWNCKVDGKLEFAIQSQYNCWSLCAAGKLYVSAPLRHGSYYSQK